MCVFVLAAAGKWKKWHFKFRKVPGSVHVATGVRCGKKHELDLL